MSLHEEVRAAVEASLRAGGNDCAVGREHGLSRTSVRQIRKRLGIAPKSKSDPSYRPLPADTLAAIDARFAAGDYDKVIARAIGVSLYRVRQRRAELGLPSFRPGDNGRLDGMPNGGKPRVENWEEKLRAGLKRGEGNTVLAQRLHMCSKQIARLRAEWGFPMFDRRKHRQANATYAGRDPLYARILAALSRAAPSVREDAAQEMYVAILLGDLREADIERLAMRFSGRQIATYTHRWSAMSLDEMRGFEGDGFSLHAVLPDDGALAAMEIAHMRALATKFGAIAS